MPHLSQYVVVPPVFISSLDLMRYLLQHIFRHYFIAWLLCGCFQRLLCRCNIEIDVRQIGCEAVNSEIVQDSV
jgi:hypothetical protein